MGPSPLGDGKVVNQGGFGHVGIRFNGAVASWRRKVSRRVAVGVHFVASMGPSPLGDGKHVRGVRHVLEVRASMGPSPLGDGKPLCAHHNGLASAASMGPSPLGDGKSAL